MRTRSTRCTGRRGSSGPRQRTWTWRAAATPGPGSRCCSSPAASGTTRWPATCSAGSSRWRRRPDGTRLLGTRTLRYMTRNHLPGGADLEAFGRPLFAEPTFEGVGFGLGFSVVLDPIAPELRQLVYQALVDD